MALTGTGLLRLYLRDEGKDVFGDDVLEHLIDTTASMEAAAALGWLLKAGSAADSPRTVTIGQMSETLGQATESFKVAIAMHRHWDRKAAEIAGSTSGVARWFEVQPDEGVVADLMDTIELINQYWDENDISRLIPIV